MKKLITSFIFLNVFITSYANPTTSIESFLNSYPSIEQIKIGLFQHKFTCQELINGYLNRIRLYNLTIFNNQAPLNAITQVNSQAILEAKQLDIKLAKKQASLGNLFCIPVVVKDNFDVAGLRSSSGSLALLGTYPIADSKIIKNIKSQDGIILAKSSMDEVAAGLSGISSLSGRIGNAYNTSYSSSGSSGGSAVSIAAGFAPLAIGTDNSGSVRIPAAFNGIYGLRPTYGLVSHEGIFPTGNLDGTAGPMANNVIDLANLLTVMVNSKFDYSKNLHKNILDGKHFAIIRSVSGKPLWNNMPKPIVTIYNTVKTNLQASGAIITTIDLPNYNLDRKYNMSGTIDDINLYLANNISSMSDFNQFCNGNTRVFGSKAQCSRFLNSVRPKNSPEYKQVIKTINKNQVYILNIMKQQHIDGLILPSGKSGIASYDWSLIGDQSIIASNSGLPEITLPAAQYKGLPVGLEIIGPKYSESALLNYAFAYQEHYYTFKPPHLSQDRQSNNWSINKLNMLYPLIGKTSFDLAIKPINKNNISPQQSISATKKAIVLIKQQ